MFDNRSEDSFDPTIYNHFVTSGKMYNQFSAATLYESGTPATDVTVGSDIANNGQPSRGTTAEPLIQFLHQ